MSKSVVEPREKYLSPQTSTRWVAIVTDAAAPDLADFDGRLIAGEGRSRKLYMLHESQSTPPQCAEAAGYGVIFDGALYNRRDLLRELGSNLALDNSNDAELILATYQRWGADFLKRLRGSFATIIWETASETVHCLRDPMGTFPLFYAEKQNGLLVSPSIDVLIKQPSISASVNRAALADYLLDRFPRMEETFFDEVSRVPPGHVLRVTRDSRRSYRYWDPAPGGNVNWLTSEEVERFDDLLDQAVSRCLSLGPAGIFLSGGLDSVSVAAVAAHRAAAEGITKPWALSLVFPESDVDEEVVQRGVAEKLGLPQVLKKFYDATGESGLLAGAIGLNSFLPAPINNTWLPAYHALVREGKQRGCRTILTGSGGDEWLTVSPMLAADLIREFDFAGVFRLWQTARHSFKRSNLALLRGLVWTFGLGPLLIPPVHRLAKRFVPSLVRTRRRIFAAPPKWLAPDDNLRRDLEYRWEERSLREKPESESFYLREAKTGLDHPLVSWEVEELFHFGQMAGVRVLHPIWDPDLVDLLYRTPPFLLIREGRNKGLVRGSLARRFPDLGFEQQRKIEATRFYASLIFRDARNIWQQLGGGRALGDLGVVDQRALSLGFDRLLERGKINEAHLAWSILNLESWARAHAS
jgi:asparagine synthase (glutamine-hydrolysing)